MEHRRSKQALFFVAQALAVGMMILVLPAPRAGAASVILTMVVIVGELWILAQTLLVDGSVWRSVLALGILSLLAAPFTLLFSRVFQVLDASVKVVIVWHLAAGLLLLVTGTAGGVSDLLRKLRRSDDSGTDAPGSSAMWPLE